MTKKIKPRPTASDIAKAKLYANLARLGITTVVINYDGSCDSGCIESIKALGSDNREVSLPDRPVVVELIESNWDTKTTTFVRRNVKRSVPICDAIESWCYDLLEQHFPGWEINDGSSGTITLDIVKKSATMDHGENVMKTYTHRVEV